MKVWAAWVAMVGVLLSGETKAEPIDGNTLLRACRYVVKKADGEQLKQSQDMDYGFCVGALTSVTNMNILYADQLKQSDRICFPNEKFTTGQAARIVVKYLDNHPELLNQEQTDLVVASFKNAFPCK